jgi:hypothetical protein
MDSSFFRTAAIFSLTSYSLIMSYTTVRINAWALRCIFNQSNIAQRITNGEFTLVRDPKAKPSKMPNHPTGTISQMVWINDRSGTEVVTAHFYEGPTGPVTPLDPKAIKIGNIRYTVHGNQKVANPEHRLPLLWMRKVYGWIRRNIICPLFGPLDRLS